MASLYGLSLAGVPANFFLSFFSKIDLKIEWDSAISPDDPLAGLPVPGNSPSNPPDAAFWLAEESEPDSSNS